MANNETLNNQSLEIATNQDIADVIVNLAYELEEQGNFVAPLLKGDPAGAKSALEKPTFSLMEVSSLLQDIADRLRELGPTEAWKPRIIVSGLREGDQVVPRFGTLASPECAQELSADEFANEGGEHFEQFTLELK
jgi:hypothetical protein